MPGAIPHKYPNIAPLGYPLQPGALASLGLLYLTALLLYYAGQFWPYGGDTRFTFRDFFNWTGVTLFLALLFEYGLLILDATLKGRPDPPLMNPRMLFREIGSAMRELSGDFDYLADMRLLKQQAMIMAFLGLAYFLSGIGLSFPAWGVTGIFICLLPASLGINFLRCRFIDLLNPGKLAGFAREQGAAYLMAVVYLVVAACAFMLALSGAETAFLAALPVALYASVLMFRTLGNSIYRNRRLYIEEPDFRANRRELAEISRKQVYLDHKLKDLLRRVKDRQVEEATRDLRHFLDSYHWENIDTVFEHVATWPDKRPGLDICRDYIAIKTDARDYMGALALCEWCLKQDRDFRLDDPDRITLLATYAASKTQYRVAVRLLLNFADAADNTQADGRQTPCLQLAARICLDELNNQRVYRDIMARLECAGRPGKPTRE